MLEKDLKRGDKVVLTKDFDRLKAGMKGIFVGFAPFGTPRIGVDWMTKIPHGHSCQGTCEDGRGWFVHASDLMSDEPVDEFLESDSLCREIPYKP